MLSALNRLIRPKRGRYSLKERDPHEPLSYATPERPTPCFFAQFEVWGEALRTPDHRWSFDAPATLALLKKTYGDFPSDWFIWERFVETIRLSCGLPLPHVKREEKGSTRIWAGNLKSPNPSIEYEGVFEIPADWAQITLSIAPVKAMNERPNKLPEATPGQRPPAEPSPSSGAPQH